MNRGLRKALHHATSLGVGDDILSRLKTIQAANASKQTLTAPERATLTHELDEIISQIGRLAASNQGDFRSDPEH
jgi:hypothetical protein